MFQSGMSNRLLNNRAPGLVGLQAQKSKDWDWDKLDLGRPWTVHQRQVPHRKFTYRVSNVQSELLLNYVTYILK